MSKCDCYQVYDKWVYLLNPYTGIPEKHVNVVGVCWGTKEVDECDCG